MELTFFDIETGGLKSNTDVLSFAYLTFQTNTNEVIDGGLLYFYHPNVIIEPGSFNVHGLTKEFLQQYEDQFESNLDKMFKVLHRANISGYNSVTFDLPRINNFLYRFGRPSVWERFHLDIMKVWKPFYGKNPKLGTVIADVNAPQVLYDMYSEQAFGESERENRAHDATYDTLHTLLAYIGAKGRGLL